MKITLNQTIGKNIKNLRNKSDITQGKLANMLGVAIATMSLYEKGERSVPLEYMVILSRIFNVTIDDLFSVSIFDNHKESAVYFEHFKESSSTFSTSGEMRLTNPHSMYFTLTDTNGDTLVFLRSSEITEGLMLVSESQIVSNLEKVDVTDLKNKRLFLSTIKLNDRTDGKPPIYTYTDFSGKSLIMKNKAMFIYYGYLIARINHVAKTDEFFFETKI